jgi:hypothetical protein
LAARHRLASIRKVGHPNVIRIDNPLALFAVSALFVVGLVVYPFMKTERFVLTPSKVIALVIALGIVMYSGKLMFFLAFLWPLSFIWFPEYWGNYTGFFRGSYIDEKSPPMLMSLMGWFFLVAFPLLCLWIMSR